MSETKWERTPKARRESIALLESNQRIVFAIYSCPECGDRFCHARGVFRAHATKNDLKAVAANPQYGAASGYYDYLSSLPRQQPDEPIHKIFTPWPDYERFSDEVEGEILSFVKATTKPANGKGPSGVGVAAHRRIKEMEATGTNIETVALLREARDWKDGRGPKPARRGVLEVSGDQYLDNPIVFDGQIRAIFWCRKCAAAAALLIF